MSTAELLILLKMKNETAAAAAEVKHSMGGIKGAMLDVGKVAGGFLAANVIGAGVGFLKGQIGSIIGEAQEARINLAQTQAVITSTGGAAGMTATAVAALADKLSLVTNFADDDVQSAENLLLTFTSIGKDVFPQATETVLNMSTALGQDLKSSAIQLGKAMNDPITGATALRRVGVALTAQQMEQIKTFQASGDIMSAQKIIMKELATEFGGSARATADPLKQMSNAVHELKEQAGLLVYPLIGLIAGGLATQVVPWLIAGTQHLGEFVDLIKMRAGPYIKEFAAVAGPAFGDFIQALRDAGPYVLEFAMAIGSAFGATWTQNVLPALQAARDLFIAILPTLQEMARVTGELGVAVAEKLQGPLAAAIGFMAEHKDEVKIFAAGMLGVLLPAIYATAAAWTAHAGAATAAAVAQGLALLPVLAIAAALGLLAVGIYEVVKHHDAIKGKILEVWGAISDFMNEKLGFIVLVATFYFEMLKNQVTTAFNVVRDIFRIAMAVIHGDWGEAWAGIKQLARDLFDGIVTDIMLKVGFLRDVLSMAWPYIKDVAVTAWNALKDAAGVVWGDIRDAIVDPIKEIIGWIQAVIDKAKELGDLGGLPGKLLGKAMDLVGLAGGVTNARQGMLAMVGEYGPELMYVPRGASVFPADETRSMLAMGGQPSAPQTVINNYHQHNYIQNQNNVGGAEAGLAALGAAYF